MQPFALSDTIAVGEFPSAEHIAILAKAGFRSVLNNQPDGEVARLLPGEAVEAAARSAGLTYRALPLETRRPSDAQLQAFATALHELPKPIFAFCYSGARPAAAWALTAAPYFETQPILAACEAAGFDMSSLAGALDERRRQVNAPATALLPQASTGIEPPADAIAERAAGEAMTATNPAPAHLQPISVLPRAGGSGGFASSG